MHHEATRSQSLTTGAVVKGILIDRLRPEKCLWNCFRTGVQLSPPPPLKNPITTAKNLRLWGFFYPCVPLKMTPVTMFYDNLWHFLWHFLSQKLRFKIPLSDSVAMFLIKLRWIFLLKIILNIIWFYYKIQLVCHIEFFRRKRNKMSEETMWLAYRAQQIQPQAKGMIYGSPGR